MFHMLCISVLYAKHASTSRSQLLQIPISSLTIRLYKSSSHQHSFTVSYLINSCGLSLDSALSASGFVSFETPDRPNSVIRFFESHGFSKTQISGVVSRCPRLLNFNPDKTLLPKFEFFYSKCVRPSDLVSILSRNPKILERSLINHIIPSFDQLKNLLQSDVKTSAAIKGDPILLTCDLENFIFPTINLFRENGVAVSHIRMLLCYHPRLFRGTLDSFKKVLEEAKALGFDPSKGQFVVAVLALRRTGKLSWERKVDAYKRWGWSEEQVFQAFRKCPWCMTKSEDKITAVMEFFVNKLGWESSYLFNCPIVFTMSLETRIKPRIAVLQFLLSKGLIRKDINQITPLYYSEKLFQKKFVDCYVEEAPEILGLLEGVKKLSH